MVNLPQRYNIPHTQDQTEALFNQSFPPLNAPAPAFVEKPQPEAPQKIPVASLPEAISKLEDENERLEEQMIELKETLQFIHQHADKALKGD